jgi:hypothetical protein
MSYFRPNQIIVPDALLHSTLLVYSNAVAASWHAPIALLPRCSAGVKHEFMHAEQETKL